MNKTVNPNRLLIEPTFPLAHSPQTAPFNRQRRRFHLSDKQEIDFFLFRDLIQHTFAALIKMNKHTAGADFIGLQGLLPGDCRLPVVGASQRLLVVIITVIIHSRAIQKSSLINHQEFISKNFRRQQHVPNVNN